MSNLPPGWDLDYDGSRWFYKFRSSGLTQYTFPQEGDEFPDFVDASAPAPTLAPEEKLESQQQVRRRGDTTVGNGRRSKSSGMSATGGPVSTTWEDDDDGDYSYFQPENFMFLGPGAYTDVSPLAEEDDTDGLSSRAKRKDVSPSMSKATTDAASDRVLSPPVSSISTPQPSRAEPVAERAVLAVDTPPQTTATPGEPQVDLVSPPEVPMLDGREQPQELPAATSFNPVGLVPEMPTGDTARAHIELHPDPVEMADNTVLAPIETFYMNMAELPSQTTPVERKETEPLPQRRRATSQPLQRVYPFQPREDDDPDRPPTPLGPSPAPTPSPQPPTDATSQEQNPSLSPFTPSPGATSITSPARPKSDIPTPDTEESHPNGQPRSTSPQQPFKINRKPTIAGPKSRYTPFSPASGTSGGPESQSGASTDASPRYSGQPGQTDSSPVPTPPATSPKRSTSETGIPHTSEGPAKRDANTPPPVPAKDTVVANLAPGQPSPPGATAGIPQRIQQRPHSNSLPGSLGPLGNPALSDVLQQFRGVPQSLQPGTPPPLPVAVPGKGKAKPKPRATPSPLGYGRRPSRESTSPDQPTLGPTIVSPPDPPSGRSAPEYPLSTPSPLEIRSSSYGAASDGSPQSQVQVQHQTVSPNRQGGPARGEQHVSGSYFPPQPPQPHGQLGRSVEGKGKGKGRASPPGPATDSPSGESPLNESRLSGLAPSRNSEPNPYVSSNFSSPGSQQAVSRPQKQQQSPPIPPKEPLPSQPQPQAPPQPASRHDTALGHFLDPITEQPENEDAASLARKASQASQASSHRHSMPVMPAGYGNTQSHSVAPPRNSGTSQPRPESVLQQQQQQQQPGGAPANVAQPRPQPGVQGIRPPGAVAPLNAGQGAPIHPSFQQQPVPGMYTPQPMHVVAGPPAGTPPTQPPEKGKSKWLSKFLKPSKTSQKAPPPQQQYAWNGPFVIPPNQSPVPAAPWSPGSVGATLAPPPPAGGQARGSAAPLQPVPPNLPPGFQTMNDGQMHQQQASGGWRVVSMSVGQPGPKQPAPMKPKTGQSQASPPKPAPPVSQPPNPLTMNPVVQPTPQSNAGPIATSQPTQIPPPRGPPVSMEKAQSPSDAGPGRSESVKSNLTNGPARTESVRSDFTTISTSEAEAQPVLKPQIVQVSGRNSTQQISRPPQIRYEPAQSAPDVHPKSQPAQRPDGLRAFPHHLQNRLSADGRSARESMVSEVSSTDSMDSRRVSVLSTGSVTPRNKGVRTGDYSGDGWGDDS